MVSIRQLNVIFVSKDEPISAHPQKTNFNCVFGKPASLKLGEHITGKL